MEKLIILYGEQNAGKTTTLRKVVELLTGYTFKTSDPKPEIRIVFTVGGKNVYLSTMGDSEDVISTNFSFFQQTHHGKTAIYELSNGKLKKINKQRVKSLSPDICITACRINKGTPNIVYNKLNELIMDVMPVTDGIQWIAKQQADVKRKDRKTINYDYEKALAIVAEVMKESIVQQMELL